MEHGKFGEFKRLLNRLGAYRCRPREAYSDGCILAVHFYAALCDRPVSWACRREHLPSSLWRGALPDQATMSRRLARPHMIELRTRVEDLLKQVLDRPPSIAVIDGKAVTVALHSRDPHAGLGRGVGNTARGYKIHAIVSAAGTILVWWLTSLDCDERTVAPWIVREVPGIKLLAGDANYDTNPLHAAVREQGAQAITPRKKSHRGGGVSHKTHDPGRLRSIRLLERSPSDWLAPVLRARTAVERTFANLTNFAGGLTCLPPWVRTYPRVLAWVQAKMIIALLQGSVTAAKILPHA